MITVDAVRIVRLETLDLCPAANVEVLGSAQLRELRLRKHNCLVEAPTPHVHVVGTIYAAFEGEKLVAVAGKAGSLRTWARA